MTWLAQAKDCPSNFELCSQELQPGASVLSMEIVRLQNRPKAIFITANTAHLLGFLRLWEQWGQGRMQRRCRPQKCFQLLGRPGGYCPNCIAMRYVHKEHPYETIFEHVNHETSAPLTLKHECWGPCILKDMNSRLSFSKDMSAWDLERGAVELSARIDEAVSGWAISQFDQHRTYLNVFQGWHSRLLLKGARFERNVDLRWRGETAD